MTMDRDQANSFYGQDPRVRWVNDERVICKVRLGAEGGRLQPHPDLDWDGFLYADEWLEFRLCGRIAPRPGAITVHVTTAARDMLTLRNGNDNGGTEFVDLDVAMAAVLGPPQ
jgi:hypothetical protein